MPYADPIVRKAYSKQHSKKWYAAHKQQVNERSVQRRKRLSPSQKALAYQNWRKKHPEKIIEQNRKNSFRQILKRYGLSEETYNSLLQKQGSLCAICFRAFRDTPLNRICVDHNHLTGKIRGLLCINCNTAIGHIREDVDLLNAIKEYLLRYRI